MVEQVSVTLTVDQIKGDEQAGLLQLEGANQYQRACVDIWWVAHVSTQGSQRAKPDTVLLHVVGRQLFWKTFYVDEGKSWSSKTTRMTPIVLVERR